jgi:hypothetical protein
VRFNRRIANPALTPWTGYIADLKLHMLLHQCGLEHIFLRIADSKLFNIAHDNGFVMELFPMIVLAEVTYECAGLLNV